MAHPIAHEGNPRTNSITISTGEVLSTATLEVEIPEPAGGTPLEQPPTPGGSPSTCPGVFEWTRTDGKEAPIVLSDPCGLSAPSIGEYSRMDWHLNNMLIQPSVNCYGYSIATGPGPASPDFIEYYVSLKALATGAPLAGPCFMASGGSPESPDTFSGYAVIVDWESGIASLELFVGGSLASIDNASTVYSASYSPSVGDIFYFQVWRPSFNTIYAAIYPSNSLASEDAKWAVNGTDGAALGLTVLNTVGFVAIGGQNGAVEFGSSGLTNCSSPFGRSNIYVTVDEEI